MKFQTGEGNRDRERAQERGDFVVWDERLVVAAFFCTLFAVISVKCNYFFPHPLTWLVDTDFFIYCSLGHRTNWSNFGKSRGEKTREEKRPYGCREFLGLCFGCFNFHYTDLNTVCLFTMAARWNLLILGESHLSDTGKVVRMKNTNWYSVFWLQLPDNMLSVYFYCISSSITF